jgi:2-polyprenyl-6-methoxyphenol hydroxylase-like FAD-dependent oxidoreductase
MAAVEKVLIVGGGIGGLSAAIALSRAGIRVEVAEIQREWQIYQVGIVVQANFIRAMAALGVADQAVAAGFPYDGLVFEDLHGNVLQRLRGAKLAGPNYPANLGMTRPALHEVLFNAACTAGATIRVGTTFRHVLQQADCVQVEFNDGSAGKYDLVVGADGIYSQLRSQLFGTQYQPRFTGQGTWRYSVPRPSEVNYSFFCMGEGLPFGKCGFIPLTRETGYVWLVQSEPGNPRHSAERLADIFRDRLKACTGIMGAMRDQITDSSRVVYRPLEALLLPPPWYRGRILLIGDAAHATTPHLGQGSAQAVEDAVVLGELLARAAPLPELLEEFMQRRYERCRFIVESSLQLGDWEQTPVPTADPVGLTARMLETVAAPI